VLLASLFVCVYLPFLWSPPLLLYYFIIIYLLFQRSHRFNPERRPGLSNEKKLAKSTSYQDSLRALLLQVNSSLQESTAVIAKRDQRRTANQGELRFQRKSPAPRGRKQHGVTLDNEQITPKQVFLLFMVIHVRFTPIVSMF
jgi:hypothetical protein